MAYAAVIDVRRLGQLILARIIAEVPELGGRVMDKAQEMTAAPYLTLGPMAALEDGAECIEAEEWTLQFDLWDRQSAKLKLAELAQKVCAALRGWRDVDEMTMHPLRVLPPLIADDPDGVTQHAVIRVVASVET